MIAIGAATRSRGVNMKSSRKTGSTCTIYKITNSENGKMYVGQTWKTLPTRFRCHINDAVSRVGHCTKLVRAIRLHGRGKFSIESLATATTQDEADALESKFISDLNTIRDGYNLKGGGAHGKSGEETIERMRVAHSGRIVTDEMRAKISAALIGRKNGPPSAETRMKIGRALAGRKASLELREKLRLAHLGKPLSKAHVEAQKRGNVGRRAVSKETCMKISAAKMGHPVSESQRRKQSETWRRKRLGKLGEIT